MSSEHTFAECIYMNQTDVPGWRSWATTGSFSSSSTCSSLIGEISGMGSSIPGSPLSPYGDECIEALPMGWHQMWDGCMNTLRALADAMDAKHAQCPHRAITQARK